MNKHWKAAQYLIGAWMLLTAAGAGFASSSSAVQSSPVRASADSSAVTAVTGASWLSHLNRQFGDTSMGKTGRLGPAPASEDAVHAKARGPAACATQGTVLHGADLYRLNCRGCHGETGAGAPPEINSVINPVRATSVPMVLEQMKKRGVDMSRAQATQLAQQAQAALLDRLHKGGKDMPAFPQLNELEVRAIIAYLRQLAGIPGAQNEQVAVHESPVRVGELIVKGTCHTCHDAAGPNPTPQQLLNGAIPPLETLPLRKNESGLIQKVTEGAPVQMGMPGEFARGRMPVFDYLTSDEAADVYLYLTQYPPSELSVLDNIAVVQIGGDKIAQATSVAGVSSPRSAAKHDDPVAATPTQRAEISPVVALAGLGLFIGILMAAGIGLTVWELRRLAARETRRKQVVTQSLSQQVRVAAVVSSGRAACRTVSARGNEKAVKQLDSNEGRTLVITNTRGGRQCTGKRLS